MYVWAKACIEILLPTIVPEALLSFCEGYEESQSRTHLHRCVGSRLADVAPKNLLLLVILLFVVGLVACAILNCWLLLDLNRNTA